MLQKYKLHSFLIALVVSIALLTGCGDAEVDQDENISEDEQTTEEAVSDEDSFPFTFTDATDTEVTIEEKPERIITTIPSLTEISFALGLEDEIVGVSEFDNYPEEVEEKERIGDLIDVNGEKIISLEPDLVLAESTMLEANDKVFDQLRESDITVAVLDEANSFADVYDTIELIAQATGTVEQGEQIIEEMETSIDDIVAKVENIPEEDRPSVWFEIDPTLWTGGQGTFMNEMVELLNAENVVGDQEGWFEFSEEEVIALDPDVIIASYGGTHTVDPIEEVNSRSSWEDITAIKEDQVYAVEEDIVQRPGPRLVEGLEEFARAIYPEIFSE